MRIDVTKKGGVKATFSVSEITRLRDVLLWIESIPKVPLYEEEAHTLANAVGDFLAVIDPQPDEPDDA
jgi:hypothetical protein